jgi:peptidoglycan/LPS O-acetylase OafA/YrhL
MIHNLIVDYSTGLGNPPFWSLGLEEQLYVLFAVVVLLRSKRMSIIGILWIALAVSICWGIVTVLFETSSSEQIGLDLGVVVIGNLKDWPFGYWFIWLLGAVAAEVYLGLIIIPSWLTSRWMIISATVLTIITNTRTRGRYAQFWLPYDGVFVQTLLLVIVRLNPLIFSVGCFAVLLRLTAAEKAGHINNRLSKIVGGIGLTTYSLYPNPLPYS